MFKYIQSYAETHKLHENIVFDSKVIKVEGMSVCINRKLITKNLLYIKELKKFDRNEIPKFPNLNDYKKLWRVTIKNFKTNQENIYITPYVSVASGHHATPKYPNFKGQDKFKGPIIHSVNYKSVKHNELEGKRVLVVGIGNSAVDVATNLYNEGKCPEVSISTRSGSWIIPNYVHGYPIDLYACRFFLNLPWKLANEIYESNIKFIYGDPRKYNLNPKMKALSAQPTLNPTLIHHLQRRHIKIKPDISHLNGNQVNFQNGDVDEYDAIINCTGYSIDLNFLDEEIRKKVFSDERQTILNVKTIIFI